MGLAGAWKGKARVGQRFLQARIHTELGPRAGGAPQKSRDVVGSVPLEVGDSAGMRTLSAGRRKELIYISSPFLLDANSSDILCCLSACPPQAFLQLIPSLCWEHVPQHMPLADSRGPFRKASSTKRCQSRMIPSVANSAASKVSAQITCHCAFFCPQLPAQNHPIPP